MHLLLTELFAINALSASCERMSHRELKHASCCLSLVDTMSIGGGHLSVWAGLSVVRSGPLGGGNGPDPAAGRLEVHRTGGDYSR